MSTEPDARAPAPPARQRILDAARDRFYADGIRAVSADRLISDAGVSKVTFYRYFPTKDDLVVVYLRGIEEEEFAAMEAARVEFGNDPASILHWYFERVGAMACTAGFRGCAFLNAAAEFARMDHPARVVVEEHRRWLRGRFADIAAGLGVPPSEVGLVADQLQLLRDGAMIAGSLDANPERVATEVLAAADAVIGAARSRHAGPGES